MDILEKVLEDTLVEVALDGDIPQGYMGILDEHADVRGQVDIEDNDVEGIEDCAPPVVDVLLR